MAAGTGCDPARVFPTLAAYISKPKCSAKRKSPKKRATLLYVNSGLSWSVENSSDAFNTLQQQDTTESSSADVTLTLDHLSAVTLPPGQWIFERLDNNATDTSFELFYTRCLVQGDLLVQKTVVINEHLDCVVNVYGKHHKQLSHDIEHTADVESVLRQVDKLKNRQHRK